MADTKDLWHKNLVDDGKDHSGDFPVSDPGDYDFELEKLDAKQHTTKAGEDCIQFSLQLRVEGKVNGQPKDVRVFDHLFTSDGAFYRIIQYAKAVGIFDEKKKAIDPYDFYKKAPGTVGRVRIKIGEYNGNKRNEVVSYLIPKKEEAADSTPDISDDDLPF